MNDELRTPLILHSSFIILHFLTPVSRLFARFGAKYAGRLRAEFFLPDPAIRRVQVTDDRADYLPLPYYQPAWRRRHGCGLCGGGHALRSSRRDQDSDACAASEQLSRTLLARSPLGLRAESSAHRHALRLRRDNGRSS